jgi:putative ABC transport system substrate-binding protein
MAMMQHPSRAMGMMQGVIADIAVKLKVHVVSEEIRSASDIGQAIKSFARVPNGALIVLVGPILAHRETLVAEAAQHRIPAIYPYRFYAEAGGLLSYGVDVVDIYRRSAAYADRILRGEKPADLPIQTPTKLELVVNLKTAKALGIEVPTSLLLRADEVIE